VVTQKIPEGPGGRKEKKASKVAVQEIGKRPEVKEKGEGVDVSGGGEKNWGGRGR